MPNRSSTITSTGIEALSHVTVVLPDQAEALEGYTETLGFEIRADEAFETPEGATGRWITVGVPGQDDLEIALVGPDPELYPPRPSSRSSPGGAEELPWGVSAMIADPYGNGFDVLQAFRA